MTNAKKYNLISFGDTTREAHALAAADIAEAANEYATRYGQAAIDAARALAPTSLEDMILANKPYGHGQAFTQRYQDARDAFARAQDEADRWEKSVRGGAANYGGNALRSAAQAAATAYGTCSSLHLAACANYAIATGKAGIEATIESILRKHGIGGKA